MSNSNEEAGFEVNLSNYLPLRDVVYNSVRDAILSESLKPGKRLMETELAQMLGVSRTPVREALRKLEIDGFIEMPPRKGAIVKGTSIKEIKDVLEIRTSLEALATRLACGKMDNKDKIKLKNARDKFVDAISNNDVNEMVITDTNFHDIIFKSTGNDKLIQIINKLKEQIYRYRTIYIRDKYYLENIVLEHDEILDAIIKNDIQKAEKAAIVHIQNQENALIKVLKL